MKPITRKKKTVVIIATVPLGTVVTVQNLGKKKKKSGSRNQSIVVTVI